MGELMNCLRIIIITEFSVLNASRKTKIFSLVVDGILRSKYGMWDAKRNLWEKYMDRRYLPILWTIKMEPFSQETTKIRIFYNFGISSLGNWFKHLTLSNLQTAIRIVLRQLLHINPKKNWLGAHYQDQIRWKYWETNTQLQRFSFRQHHWQWIFTNTTIRTLWL